MRFTTVVVSIVIVLFSVGPTNHSQTNNPAEPQRPVVSFNSGKGRSISARLESNSFRTRARRLSFVRKRKNIC